MESERVWVEGEGGGLKIQWQGLFGGDIMEEQQGLET